MSARIYIENERLLIRGLIDQDLDRLKAMRNDERIYRYEPTFLTELQGSPEEALKSIQEMNLDRDRQCIWGIFEKDDPDKLVGLAELYDYKPSGKVISMGYRLMPEYWGRGIASSCNSALTDYIKSNTQVEMITAHVLPENTASSRILLKNGFEYLLTKTEDWGYRFPCVADVYILDL